MPVQIIRPVTPNIEIQRLEVQPLQVQGYKPLTVDPTVDPERARALIAKLQKDKRAMREKMQQTLAELQNARTTIDEMTRVGGSLVRAQCVSATLSRTTSGIEENWAASAARHAPRRCSSSAADPSCACAARRSLVRAGRDLLTGRRSAAAPCPR